MNIRIGSFLNLWANIIPQKDIQRLRFKIMPFIVRELKLGDLILYKANNQSVCHRLVKKIQTNNGYLIYARGDAFFGSAELVNEQMFLGKVIGIIRNDKITSLEGARQRVINRISLIISPLLNFIIKSSSSYIILLKRIIKKYFYTNVQNRFFRFLLKIK